MKVPTDLFAQHLCHARIAVAERIDSNAGCEVEILPVLNVPHVASLALLEHRWWADIGRDHVWELLVHEAGGLGAWVWIRSCETGIALHNISRRIVTQEQHRLTAIESFRSCGKLEPWTAAEAAEAKRADRYCARGARNARLTRVEDIRSAMMYVGIQDERV